MADICTIGIFIVSKDDAGKVIAVRRLQLPPTQQDMYLCHKYGEDVDPREAVNSFVSELAP